MSIEISAEAQKAMDELPGDQAALDAAKTELEGVDRRLNRIDAGIEEIEQKQAEEISTLETDRTKAMLDSYDPHLQSVIAFALGNEDMKLPLDPDFETCQRIAELDASIKASAGQPIVVINPAKGWIDFGTLQEADPEGRIEAKGLVFSQSPSVHSKTRIELPVNNVLAIDPETGEYPERGTDPERELFAREQGFDTMHRPIVDPTETKAVLPSETPEDYVDEDGQTALILIGHTHLRNVLNSIYGFEAGEDRQEAYGSFHRIELALKQLREKGISFDDPDFIDGYLLYRISVLEETMERDGLSREEDGYRKDALEALWTKYSDLKEAGWLS